MSPLGYTVGFIHRNEWDRVSIAEYAEGFRGQAFRCNVHDLIGMIRRPVQDCTLLPGCQAGVEECRPDAVFFEGKHLIQHQGNQRRNDERQSLKGQGRDLETDRFSGTRRHNAHHIAAAENCIDQPLLSRTEGIISESIFKYLLSVQFSMPLQAGSNIHQLQLLKDQNLS